MRIRLTSYFTQKRLKINSNMKSSIIKTKYRFLTPIIKSLFVLDISGLNILIKFYRLMYLNLSSIRIKSQDKDSVNVINTQKKEF